jgi:hypothetical protein
VADASVAQVGQGQQKQSSGAALRAYLAGARTARQDIGVVLGSIELLFEKLKADKLVATKGDGAFTLRVRGAGRVVTLEGSGRREGDKVIPVISFRVGDRPVHVSLAHLPGAAWTWSDGAGIGVDGLAISPETVSLVFLKLLAGEV